MICDKNRPECAGAMASQKLLFGARSRYALYAIHTRFDRVEWVIADAERPDEITRAPDLIRQYPAFQQAIDAMRAIELAGALAVQLFEQNGADLALVDSGLLAEFIPDETEQADIAEQIREHGYAIIGGGAEPEYTLKCAG